MTEWIKFSDQLPKDDERIVFHREDEKEFYSARFVLHNSKSKIWTIFFCDDYHFMVQGKGQEIDSNWKYWMSIPGLPND